MTRVVAALLLLLPALALALAPATVTTATTLEALARYPGFFHLKVVIVHGRLIEQAGRVRLVPASGEGRGVEVVGRQGQSAEASSEVGSARDASQEVEVRGQFFDVGRLSPDDPSVSNADFPALVRARVGDRWPAHGELLAINLSQVLPVPLPSQAPSLRLLALDPARYDNQFVRVRGRFAGRNLLGDLPQAPRISRSDFVMSNAGGAVWVTGRDPRGRGWQLDPSSRLDTDQWLEVEGTVHTGDGLVWLEAKSITPARADAVATSGTTSPAAVLPPPPLEVVFSVPTEDDTDVAPTAPVKLQLSRDLDLASLAGRITVSYLGQPAGAPGPSFKASFDAGSRALQLTFDQPLERFRTVKVELREGIQGSDGRPLKPFTLTFSTGG
jgi:hypothetical protein